MDMRDVQKSWKKYAVYYSHNRLARPGRADDYIHISAKDEEDACMAVLTDGVGSHAVWNSERTDYTVEKVIPATIVGVVKVG